MVLLKVKKLSTKLLFQLKAVTFTSLLKLTHTMPWRPLAMEEAIPSSPRPTLVELFHIPSSQFTKTLPPHGFPILGPLLSSRDRSLLPKHPMLLEMSLSSIPDFGSLELLLEEITPFMSTQNRPSLWSIKPINKPALLTWMDLNHLV